MAQLQEKYSLHHEDVMVIFFSNIQEKRENSQNYIKDFENFYFQTRPRLSSSVIRQLLFGL